MRDKYYDIVKGIAIILVTYAHCIQTFSPNYHTDTLFLTIIAFHMPLFMMISGKFFLHSLSKNTLTDFIQKRFIRLYLPSLSWGLIGSLLIGGGKILKHSDIDISFFITNTFTGMWFLTILFFLSAVGAVIEKKSKGYNLFCWLLLFVIITVMPEFWMRKELLFMMPFFVCAIYYSKYDWNKIPSYIAFTSFAIFIMAFQHYSFKDSMYQMTDQWQTFNYHRSFILRFILGLTGSVNVLWICSHIRKFEKLTSMLISLGVTTLPIYVIHQKFLLPFVVTNFHYANIAIYILGTITIIALSLMVYKTFVKNKHCKLLLFGEL